MSGMIYCASMMTIYRNDSEAMVAAYWRRLDPDNLESDSKLDGFDEAGPAHIARHIIGCQIIQYMSVKG
jgi:hypothetical protein